MAFQVTHIAADGRRHRQVVQAASNALAVAFMEQLYGVARGFAAIRVQGGAA